MYCRVNSLIDWCYILVKLFFTSPTTCMLYLRRPPGKKTTVLRKSGVNKRAVYSANAKNWIKVPE